MKEENKLLDLKTLLAMTLADVEIFLLMDEGQQNYNERTYTPAEIMAQMHKSIGKVCDMLRNQGVDVDQPIKANLFA